MINSRNSANSWSWKENTARAICFAQNPQSSKFKITSWTQIHETTSPGKITARFSQSSDELSQNHVIFVCRQ